MRKTVLRIFSPWIGVVAVSMIWCKIQWSLLLGTSVTYSSNSTKCLHAPSEPWFSAGGFLYQQHSSFSQSPIKLGRIGLEALWDSPTITFHLSLYPPDVSRTALQARVTHKNLYIAAEWMFLGQTFTWAPNTLRTIGRGPPLTSSWLHSGSDFLLRSLFFFYIAIAKKEKQRKLKVTIVILSHVRP